MQMQSQRQTQIQSSTINVLQSDSIVAQKRRKINHNTAITASLQIVQLYFSETRLIPNSIPRNEITKSETDRVQRN